MNNRAIGFASLLGVIGVSIVFGMILGGKLNAPEVAHAAPPTGRVELAPASRLSPVTSFADIVEESLPAVVSVRSAQTDEEEGRGNRRSDDPLWQWFFGPQGEGEDRRAPTPRQQPRIGEGSGFIISSDGYILTNHHVVEDADELRVGMSDGKQYEARIVGTDPSIDLALIKVDLEDLPTLPLGNSKDLRVGEWVIAIGNPLDYQQTVTVGVVSAKERRVPIGSTDGGVVSFIQTDAAINFGNSGGPLLDSAGNVIGINTAIRRADYAEGIGFALPINQARRVIEQLRERGYVRRGYIGIEMNPNGIDETVREYYGLPDERGVLIDRVTEDGPADRAGLRRGDIIREVDGEMVRDNLDLIGKISTRQPGDKVDLEVFRKGKTVSLRATLKDRGEGLAARNGGANRPPEMQREEDREATGLGFTVGTLSDRIRERMQMDSDQGGVIVTDVDFQSDAAEKGILPSMVVTAINDEPIRDVGDWEDVLENLASGEPAKIDLLAGGRSLSVFIRVPDSD